MPDSLLIDEFRAIDVCGLQPDTVRTARRDRILAHSLSPLAAALVGGIEIRSASVTVQRIVGANRALAKDRRACSRAWYAQEASIVAAVLDGILALDGYGRVGLEYVRLSQPLDPWKHWRFTGQMILMVWAVCFGFWAFFAYDGWDLPVFRYALAGIGGFLSLEFLLLNLPRGHYIRKARIERAAILEQEARYVDECLEDAFPPPQASPIRRAS